MFVTFRLKDCEIGYAVECKSLEELEDVLSYVNNDIKDATYLRVNKSKKPLKNRLNINHANFCDRFMS